MIQLPQNPRRVLIARVNFLWNLLALIPILAAGYAAAINWLPSWQLLLAMFALFMWLFSMLFAAYAVLMRWLAKRKEMRQ
ncbi:MAG: hypothetical protein MO846_07675 [Candidatus Devosia symbiotica]|nr:hypothetical protein [Candidatus Devosia symbiotica]